MKCFSFIFGAIFFTSVFGCNQVKSQEGLTHLNPEEFQFQIGQEGVQLIDVRKPEEVNSGYIPNAINMNYFSDNFVSSIKKLDTLKPVYIYCRSGKRSVNSVKHFKEAGFTQIYNLEGGILNWQSDGLPLHNTK